MKRRKLFAGLLTAMALMVTTVASSIPAMADAMRVVTLGADLSQEQQQKMLNYFKVKTDEVRVIYVTNKDEREHLGSYVPLEQIGTRTVSCAFVRPTTSGGIKVRTANLNWVTGNMIATALSTSGVSNCEVIAACPFEVSGTGALTGVLMAYEVASGETLDQQKKEIATEEIVVTGKLADNVGQNEAINVINSAKMEVIANEVQSADEIYNIVNNIVNQNNIDISVEELNAIVYLLEEIAEQNYDYEEMAETLEMVESNVAGQAEDTTDNSVSQEPVDEDSILNDVNEEVLGDNVVVSSTNDGSETSSASEENWDVEMTVDQSANPQSSGTEEPLTMDPVDNQGEPEKEDDILGEIAGWFGFDETNTEDQNNQDNNGELVEIEGSSDDNNQTDGSVSSDNEGQTDDTGSSDSHDQTDTGSLDSGDVDDIEDMEEDDILDTSMLDSEDQEKYKELELFCKGEFEGSSESLQEALNDPNAHTDVTLDTATGEAISKLVRKEYISVLGNGALDPNASSFDDVYMSAELNQVNRALKKIFGIDGNTAAPALASVSQEDCQTLYKETLSFFEKLYDESDSWTEVSSEASDTAANATTGETTGTDGASIEEYDSYEEIDYTEDGGLEEIYEYEEILE